ncbi:type 12 methyltransferase [Rhodococcus ruber BKS 20-38]|uniref:Type 12 methyltransferase n=1 Tax=Rhodococcus ruber BKS 20-38 TaxID=1278076 RepID=M2Y2K3_9NOCA|nr:class I SAM-dependent methyltransferase [Rhodococcus ruber]EME55785.1 type 12 methyltransferase [Rhodococcus ruber BKS 20-38]
MTDIITNTISTADLVAAWDAQQEAYVAYREQRFEVMLELVADLFARADNSYGPDGTGAVAFDAACGPGSLSRRLLDRFPGVRVIGVDYDPALLALAADSLAGFGSRFSAVDADLADPRWPDALPAPMVDVVVSSTALHWLAPETLVGLYCTLGDVVADGGVLLNADHLRYHPVRQGFMHAAADGHDRRSQASRRREGAMTWEQWWCRAAGHPVAGPLVAERERRFADRPPTTLAPLDFHLQALATAGFSETGTVWQYLDDYVVFARR